MSEPFKPIIKSGRASQLDRSPPPLGHVYALEGPAGRKVETTSNGPGFLGRMGYSTYILADVTRRAVSFSIHAASADSRFGFVIDVIIETALVDPFAFSADLGADGNVLQPFYGLVSNAIEQEALAHSPDDLSPLRQRLIALEQFVSTGDAIRNGMRLWSLSAKPRHDDAYRAAVALEEAARVVAAGVPGLLAQWVANPGDANFAQQIEALRHAGADQSAELRQRLDLVHDQLERIRESRSPHEFDTFVNSVISEDFLRGILHPPTDALAAQTAPHPRRISGAETTAQGQPVRLDHIAPLRLTDRPSGPGTSRN